MSKQRSKKTLMKGLSAVSIIPYVDIIHHFAVDAMHCVWEGIVKMLLKFWFSSTYSRMNFSLVSLLPKINKGLEQARFPHDFSRQARPYCKKWKGSDEKFSMQLSYFLFFTAIEYKNFLLYLYIPVVRELQRNEYQTHTTKLVRVLKVLWSRSITNEELDLAERLINEFLADLEKLYGKQAMTYNAHILTHLPDSVRRFGPLWTHACF